MNLNISKNNLTITDSSHTSTSLDYLPKSEKFDFIQFYQSAFPFFPSSMALYPLRGKHIKLFICYLFIDLILANNIYLHENTNIKEEQG
jgi:hypothetical protein